MEVPKYALTLRPEWAFAVQQLGKDVENRTWAPRPDHLGTRIAIHAGATRRKAQIAAVLDLAQKLGMDVELCGDDVCVGTGQGLRHLPVVTRGIVAVATVAEAVTMSTSPWYARGVPGDAPVFGWVLKDVISLDRPVAVTRGQLGLWRLAPETFDELTLRIKEHQHG